MPNIGCTGASERFRKVLNYSTHYFNVLSWMLKLSHVIRETLLVNLALLPAKSIINPYVNN